MDMQFVAALQIIIYVGGIVVLIIFSIFLTAQAGERLPKQKSYRIILGLVITFTGFAFTLWTLSTHVFTKANEKPVDPSVQNIGHQLLNYNSFGYVFPFEVVSILLLAALIGSVVIAIKDKK
jgi:NADH-quinone oxidoreductase subunit J